MGRPRLPTGPPKPKAAKTVDAPRPGSLASIVEHVQKVNTLPCQNCEALRQEMIRMRGRMDSYEAELASFERDEDVEQLIERHIRMAFRAAPSPIELLKTVETAVKYYAAKAKADPDAMGGPKPQWGSALGGGGRDE